MTKKKRITQADKDKERARLYAFLRVCPPEMLRFFRVADVIRYLGIKLELNYARVLIRQYQEGQETDMKQKEQPIEPMVVLEKIATIVSKTYAHLGDGEQLASEDANNLVYSELKKYDPQIILRNQRRSLPKKGS